MGTKKDFKETEIHFKIRLGAFPLPAPNPYKAVFVKY